MSDPLAKALDLYREAVARTVRAQARSRIDMKDHGERVEALECEKRARDAVLRLASLPRAQFGPESEVAGA